jgi:hypothetical protein
MNLRGTRANAKARGIQEAEVQLSRQFRDEALSNVRSRAWAGGRGYDSVRLIRVINRGTRMCARGRDR